MHRSLFTLGLLSVGALTLFSCKKAPVEGPIETMIPLAVGNQWVYRVARFDASGTPLDTTHYTRTVVKDTLINGATWYLLTNRSLVRNTSRGYSGFNGAGQEALIIYPNSTVGSFGYGFDRPGGYKQFVYTVPDNVLRPVGTPKGSFSCRQYTIENQYTYPDNSPVQIVRREDYLAPGLGVVKSDLYYRDSPVLQQRTELIDYALK